MSKYAQICWPEDNVPNVLETAVTTGELRCS